MVSSKDKLQPYAKKVMVKLSDFDLSYVTGDYKIHPFIIFYCYPMEVFSKSNSFWNKKYILDRILDTKDASGLKLSNFEQVLEAKYSYILGYKYVDKYYNLYLSGKISLETLLEVVVEDYVNYDNLNLSVNIDELLLLGKGDV
jgi:hypothetical protein